MLLAVNAGSPMLKNCTVNLATRESRRGCFPDVRTSSMATRHGDRALQGSLVDVSWITTGGMLRSVVSVGWIATGGMSRCMRSNVVRSLILPPTQQ